MEKIQWKESGVTAMLDKTEGPEPAIATEQRIPVWNSEEERSRIGLQVSKRVKSTVHRVSSLFELLGSEGESSHRKPSQIHDNWGIACMAQQELLVFLGEAHWR